MHVCQKFDIQFETTTWKNKGIEQCVAKKLKAMETPGYKLQGRVADTAVRSSNSSNLFTEVIILHVRTIATFVLYGCSDL